MPQVSVITPCYNSARYVRRTIESVRSQALEDWEHVVVDDGSTDESAAIIEELCRLEPRLRLVRQQNRGVSAARNAGFAATSAGSEYLLFLDADDCLEPQMLRTMVDYMSARPEVGLAYCDVTFIDSDDIVLDVTPAEMGWSPRHVPTRFGVRALPDDCATTPFISVFALTTIIPSISLLRRSVYDQTPGWDPLLGHVFEDTDLFLQMALRSNVSKVSRRLVRYRRHANQSTASLERIGTQQHKLRDKWRNIAGLTDSQRAMVLEAQEFIERRFDPYCGMRSGMAHLRHGRIGKAARFFGGALRRYVGLNRASGNGT
jgi:glycosyltransferase involved in cell wall biosynthesis